MNSKEDGTFEIFFDQDLYWVPENVEGVEEIQSKAQIDVQDEDAEISSISEDEMPLLSMQKSVSRIASLFAEHVASGGPEMERTDSKASKSDNAWSKPSVWEKLNPELLKMVEKELQEAEAQRNTRKALGVEWYKDFLPPHSKKLEVLHFNDIYNIEPRAEVGPPTEGQPGQCPTVRAGAARF